MKIYVTGSTGVIGHRVIRLLVADGHDVSAHIHHADRSDRVSALGATPARADLFEAGSVATAVRGHDAIIHLATSIPLGNRAARRKHWAENDRLRRDASANLAAATIEQGIERYIGESVTFPYCSNADAWINEGHPRQTTPITASTNDAERAAERVTDSGVTGIALRFALHFAPDSPSTRAIADAARKGRAGLFGELDDFISFIDVDDAAEAVVRALDAPAGIYNVAEAQPLPRADHFDALARLHGRSTLTPISRVVTWLAGDIAKTLGRSHRVATDAFADATGWCAKSRPLDRWAEIDEMTRS